MTMSVDQRGPGRPTVVTAEVMSALCVAIVDGLTVKQFCDLDGNPCQTAIYRALAKNEEFAKDYAQAREAQLMSWEDGLLEIADDGRNDFIQREIGETGGTEKVLNAEHINRSRLRVDTRKWIMSHRLPKRYGDRVEQVMSGSVGVRHEDALDQLK